MKQIPTEVSKLIELYGYNVSEQLNAWDKRGRFFVYKLSKNNLNYVLKVASHGFESDLNNEVWWNLTLKRLTEADPSIKVRAPLIETQGANFYIGEFFEAQPLIKDGFKFDKAEMEPWLGRISKVLIDFDQMALQPRKNHSPIYEDTNSAPYTKLEAKVDQWMRLPLENGQIDEKLIVDAKQLIKKYSPYILPRLQHGNFVPWLMYDLGEELIGIIGGEHASLTKPRFYDLAYIYSRLVTRMKSFETARKLLSITADGLKEDDDMLEKAWLPVITLRALGMINDAEADLEKTDYREFARMLLDMCFEENLKVFMEDK
jgi:hypothetical protein